MSGIDFSDEGLAGRIEGVEEGAVVEAVADPEPEVEAAPEVVEEEAPAEEPEPAADPEPQVEVEPANEWQVRYDEAQKVIGRQGQELGELRRMMEQIQAAQQQPQHEPEDTGPFVGRQPQTQNELLEMAATPEEAIDAYRFAVENAPDLIPDVLAEVQMHDPGLAKRMEMDLYQAMLQAQVGSVQERVNEVEGYVAPDPTATAVGAVAAATPDWTDIAQDVAQIIEENPDLISEGDDDATPEQIKAGVRAAVKMARQARELAQKYAQNQVGIQRVQQRQAAAVETGTPAAAPPPTDVSDADAIRNAIFAEDKRRRAIFD